MLDDKPTRLRWWKVLIDILYFSENVSFGTVPKWLLPFSCGIYHSYLLRLTSFSYVDCKITAWGCCNTHGISLQSGEIALERDFCLGFHIVLKCGSTHGCDTTVLSEKKVWTIEIYVIGECDCGWFQQMMSFTRMSDCTPIFNDA